jgi:hypothetical protein
VNHGSIVTEPAERQRPMSAKSWLAEARGRRRARAGL